MRKTIRQLIVVTLTLVIIACGVSPAKPTLTLPTPTIFPELTVTPTPHPLAINVQNASQIKLQKTIGAGTVNDVAWSPNGNVIAIAQDFDILFYDSSSLELIGSVDFGGTGIVFSPDGKFISIVSNMSVIVWDITNNLKTWEFVIPDVFRKEIIYNNQGSLLVFAGSTVYDASGVHFLHVWDVISGEQVYLEEMVGGFVEQIEFSPNDELLAVQTGWGLELIDLSKNSIETNKSHWGEDSFSFFSDAQYFGRTEDGYLSLVEINGFNVVQIFDTKLNVDGSKFVISPNKKRLILLDYWGMSIQIWDLENSMKIAAIDLLIGFQTPVVKISPDSQSFLLVYGGDVSKYNLLTGEKINKLEFTSQVSEIKFVNDSHAYASYSILAGYSSGKIHHWLLDGKLSTKFEGHIAPINRISLSPDGSELASSSDDFSAKIWDTKTGSLLRTVNCSVNNFVQAAMYSMDKKYFVLECMGQIEIWDTETWAQIDSTSGYYLQEISSMKNLTVLFPLGGSNYFKVEDVFTRKNVYEFYLGYEYNVLDAAFSRDGAMLAVVDGQNTVILWDVNNKTPKYYLLEDGMECTYMECQEQSVAFSPDNSLLISSNEDQKMVRLWDVESGKQILALPLENNVNVVAFSPDGRYLIAGCDDGRIYVWGIE